MESEGDLVGASEVVDWAEVIDISSSMVVEESPEFASSSLKWVCLVLRSFAVAARLQFDEVDFGDEGGSEEA